MRRVVSTLLGVTALLLALAAPAIAHNLVVDPPGAADERTHWVGAGGPAEPIPGQGQGLAESPIGNRPAGHEHGLPVACQRTNENPSAVTFEAPPFFTGCHHGLP
jgi:hypothetical protein